jgi:hypothetical protein
VLSGCDIFYARFGVAWLAIHTEITGRALRRLGYYLIAEFFSLLGLGIHLHVHGGRMVARGAFLILGLLLVGFVFCLIQMTVYFAQ